MVQKIKNSLEKMSVSEVANKYMINYETIKRIKTGQTFKNI